MLLSLALLGAERWRPAVLEPARAAAEFLGTPLHWLVAAPGNSRHALARVLRQRRFLQEENRALRQTLLTTRAQLQTLEALREENRELLQLLQDSTGRPLQKMLPATVRNISTAPSRHWLQLDRGADDGAAVGMAAIDGRGIMGQLTRVWSHSSRLLLLTDSRNAIGTYIERNGVRAIVEGNGSGTLVLRHITHTTDIRIGDRLLSSGLGGRFPGGYPVARVSDIQREADKPFLSVEARPIAQLWRSRRLLLLAAEEAP